MAILLSFIYVSSFSVSLAISRARVTIRDGDCVEAVSALLGCAGDTATPFVAEFLPRSEADTAENECLFCFFVSLSAGVVDEGLRLNQELSLSFAILMSRCYATVRSAGTLPSYQPCSCFTLLLKGVSPVCLVLDDSNVVG
jgi:hypothetical protein